MITWDNMAPLGDTFQHYRGDTRYCRIRPQWRAFRLSPTERSATTVPQ